MILYRLKCAFGHEFDGWFRAGEDYERQAKRHSIECPECGSFDVDKAIMAPNVARTDRVEAPAPASAPVAAPASSPKGPPSPEQVATYFAAVRKHVEDNFDYVGEKFPEEARKIHYGESDERDIYGEATPEQAMELAEEGIEVAPLPGAKKRRSRARAN
jgi:hypothetical protein